MSSFGREDFGGRGDRSPNVNKSAAALSSGWGEEDAARNCGDNVSGGMQTLNAGGNDSAAAPLGRGGFSGGGFNRGGNNSSSGGFGRGDGNSAGATFGRGGTSGGGFSRAYGDSAGGGLGRSGASGDGLNRADGDSGGRGFGRGGASGGGLNLTDGDSGARGFGRGGASGGGLNRTDGDSGGRKFGRGGASGGGLNRADGDSGGRGFGHGGGNSTGATFGRGGASGGGFSRADGGSGGGGLGRGGASGGGFGRADDSLGGKFGGGGASGDGFNRAGGGLSRANGGVFGRGGPSGSGFNRTVGGEFDRGEDFNIPAEFYGEDRSVLNNFVPEVRTVEDLYKEDVEHAENYRQIADDDDEIHVSGPKIGHYAVIETWHEAQFPDILLKNVMERSKYVRPRKIQAYIIPIVMDGRDVKGHAETGSGKTAAFMLPIIQKLMNNPNNSKPPLGVPAPYAIIVEPTRELCNQVCDQGRKLAYETEISVAKAYGQYKMSENLRELRVGCDILCATPGRLKHFILSNLISVENVAFFVLDEADTLLETNFIDEIREICSAPNFPDKQNRQTMLFSATFPEMVQRLSADVLKEDCVFVSNEKMVAANSKVIQHFQLVSAYDKKQKLLDLLMDEIETQKKIRPGGPQLCQTLVFVRTKRDADLVSLFLCEKGIKATTINGDRSQMLREQALKDFRNSDVLVLVSTDVCARGIDIKNLDHVINMDLPNDAVTYVHRIGRTGRLKHGRATSFFDENDANDTNIAKKLVEFLRGVDQDVPDFLMRAAEGGSAYVGSYEQAQRMSDGW